MIILQIIGGIFLTLIVLVILAIIYFRVKFGKLLGTENNQEPLTVHLNEDISPAWLEKEKAKAIVDELKNLGYWPGKAYSIYEMDGCFLQSFFKGPLVAVLYSHTIVGYWLDIVINEKDKIEHTFSNAPMGSGIEQRPESSKLFKADAGVAELHALAEDVSRTVNTEFVDITNENFREYFETSYKKDIAWRNRKGGINFEEFTKIEQESSLTLSQENVEEAFVSTKLNELHQWHTAALDEYRRDMEISQDDFYEQEYKLLIVPFTTNAKAFFDYLEEKYFINQNQLEQYSKLYSEETDIQKLFDDINRFLSPDLRAEKIGETAFPLEIKIYRMSEEMLNQA